MVPQLVGLTLVLWLTGHCMHLLFNMYHIKLLFNLQYIYIHYCFDSSQLCYDDRKTCFVSSSSSSSQANSSPIHRGKGFTSKTDIPISQNLWQYPCIARLLFPPTPQSSAVLNFDCNSSNSCDSKRKMNVWMNRVCLKKEGGRVDLTSEKKIIHLIKPFFIFETLVYNLFGCFCRTSHLVNLRDLN